jgi:signal transduction histidine kinase
MRSASLSTRMIVASVVLAVLVAGGFGVLIHAVSTLNDATAGEARAKDVTAATLRLEKLVVDLETGFRGFVLSGNERVLEPYTRARAELPRRLQEFERLAAMNPAQEQSARRLVTAIHEYVDGYLVYLVEIARTNLAAVRTPDATVLEKRQTDVIRGRFSRYLAAEDALAAASAASAQSESDQAIRVAIGGLVVSTLFIILFGLYLARSTAEPVRAVSTAATRLAEGDLSVRLPEQGPGEVGALTTAFNRMAGRLEHGRAELEAQNTKLRESERRKSELVSIVSHELRTPLASVLGFTSLLLNRGIEPKDQRRYLEIIDAQGRRLSLLLNDFLDVEKLEEGELELAQELIEMGIVIGEQVQLFEGQSVNHRLDVVLPTEPLPVRGDPNRLAQVVGNLLSNAIKYSPDGGTVEVVGEQDENLVRVSVRDHGLGIPDELQTRVFGKFFRGDAGASGIPGSGLGLTISRSVVEAHGGRISFESASGKGSVFWLELPIAANDR